MPYDHAGVTPGFDSTEGLLVAAEVGTLLRVDPHTVIAWARSGKIPSLRTPGGSWRFSAKWLREYQEQDHGE